MTSLTSSSLAMTLLESNKGQVTPKNDIGHVDVPREENIPSVLTSKDDNTAQDHATSSGDIPPKEKTSGEMSWTEESREQTMSEDVQMVDDSLRTDSTVERTSKDDNQGKVALDVDNQGKVAPDVDNQGKVAPDVDNQGKVAPDVDNQRKVAPDVENQGKMASDVDNQGKVAPDVDNQGKVAPDVDNQGKVAPDVDNQGKMASDVDKQGKVALDVDNQGKVAPDVDNQGKMAPDVDNQGKVAPDVDNQEKVAPDVDNQGKVALDVDNQGKVAPDVENQGKMASDVDNQGKVAPDVDNQGKMAPDVDNQGKVAPDVDNQGKVAPDVDNQGKMAPDVDNQGKVAPDVDNQGKMVSDVDNQGKMASDVDNHGKMAPDVDSVRKKVHTKDDHHGKKSSKDPYFESYDNYGVHLLMLKDVVRTGTYKKSMIRNKHLFRGKVVLDVGCGTGILCMFAAEAGASKVIGVDCSDIINYAEKIIADNKLGEVIKLVKGKVEDISLPGGIDQVDIIVSEWMGHSLLYESMLNTVIYARDKWLKPGGLIFPDRATLYIAAIDGKEYIQDTINFWDDVYGYDMRALRRYAATDAAVQTINPACVVTNSCLLKDLDLYRVKTEDLSFTVPFHLQCLRDEFINGLVTYFTVEFTKCLQRTGFSTAPEATTTHWRQTGMFFDGKELEIKKGEQLFGTFKCQPNKEYVRGLDLSVNINFKGGCSEMDDSMQYYMRW